MIQDQMPETVQESVERPLRLLVSIHGMRTEGAWQEEFKGIFDPHFRYERFKFGEFRNPISAVLWIALEVWVILFGVAAASLAWVFDWLPSPANWGIAFIIWIVLFLGAGFFADARRNKVVDNFLEWIARQRGNERSPHIIAHSLGTFIVGRMLQNYAYMAFAQVIFVGSVLNPRYGWQDLMNRFEVVRNEVSGKDWVSAIAFVMRAFVPEMGPSGIYGFKQVKGFVRTLGEQDFGDPWRPCAKGCSCGCGEIECPEAQVLNVQSNKIGHLNPARQKASLIWLPFLWNLPPKLHREFLLLCQKCAALEAGRKKSELKDAVAELSGRCWFWTKGTLADCVRKELEANRELQSSSIRLNLAVRNLYQVIDRAARHNASPEAQVYLHPEIALQLAIDNLP